MSYLDDLADKRKVKSEDADKKKTEFLLRSIDGNIKSNSSIDKLASALESISKVEGPEGKEGKPGRDGKTPIKGKDYFTEQEIAAIARDIEGRIRVPEDGKTPLKGVDYFTPVEIREIIASIVSRLPMPEDGKDGKDAELDYEKLIKDVVKRIPKPKDGKDGRDGVNTFVTAPGKNPYATVGYRGEVKITEGDQTPGFLADKIKAGANITLTQNEGDIVISASGSGGGGAVDSVNGQTGTVVLDPDDLDDTSTSHKFVSSSDLTTLSNTSGTNTGDQDLSGLVPNTRTVNGQALSSNVTLDADDVLPTQTGNNGKYLSTDGSTSSWQTLAGGGDMAAVTYDPQNIADDAFDRANHTGTQALSSISDITASAAEVNTLDGITATVTELNYTDGVTSAIQTQLDTKETIAKLNPIAVSTSTAAATAAKVGTTTGGTYSPATGDVIIVTFTTANTATNPTLNIDSSGAKSILLGNINPSSVGLAGTKVMMWYDGTAWQLFGSQRTSDANTTYLEATAFTTVTATTQAAAVNSGYIANHASTEINFTLPATAAIGQIVHVIGLGAGGWRVTAPSGDNILIDGNNTGAAGYITGGQYATVGLRCIVANTTWEVIDYTGTVQTGVGYSTAKQPLDSDLTALATAGNSSVLAATTASFLTADETKLDGIEALADVTDDANVKAALDGMTLSDVGTPASGDRILLQDASDSNNLKYADFSDFGGGGGGSGDVVGPASSTDNAIARFDGTDGKTLQNSSFTIDDTGKLLVANGSDYVGMEPAYIEVGDAGGDATTITGSDILTNTLYTGTIEEDAIGVGVTIDGVLVKDGEVHVGNGFLKTDHLFLYQGGTAYIEAGFDTTDTFFTFANETGGYAAIGTYGVFSDEINEANANAGVTIDGVLIKDGEVDGIDLGAITASETELNYTDGVTSAIQTQLDNKQPLDADLTTIAGLTATTDNFMVANSSAWASRTPAQARTHMGLGSLATASTISNSDWSGTDLSVANGGTGVSTLTSGNVLVGAGTSAVTTTKAAPSGDFVGTTDSQALTNKTLTTPTIAQINSTTGVGVSVEHQTDNSDSITTSVIDGVKMKTGWGQMNGNGAVTMSQTVTLGNSFTTILGVVCSPMGGNAGSATSITAITAEVTSNPFTVAASDLANGSFTATLTRSAGTFGAGTYFAYTWIAWGV